MATERATMAMVSHVMPVPPTGGQNQRVRFTIEAFRRHFDVTLVTADPNAESTAVAELVDDVIVVDAPALPAPIRRARAVVDELRAAARGLKRSNIQIDRMFAPGPLAEALDPGAFDVAFFHYWHAQRAVEVFRSAGVPCVLDMHDVLWRARRAQLESAGAPGWWVDRQAGRYQIAEEAGWRRYDALVAINEAEADDARRTVPDAPVWYAPMGVHLDRWHRDRRPASPPRVTYYGGLSSPERERSVLRCVDDVMPLVWEHRPEVEFWIVGARPTPAVVALGDRERVTVTGFVEDPAAVLSESAVVLCPFSGTYGFRSRLIEVLATGTTVVATHDAVHGMGLEPGAHLMLGADDAALARGVLAAVEDMAADADRAAAARAASDAFGFDATYGMLAREIAAFVAGRSTP